MKVKILVISINVFFFLSCNSKEVNHTQNINEKTKVQDSISQVQTNSITQRDTSKKEIIYDYEFIMRVVEKDLSLQNLKEIYQPQEIYEILVQNKHNINKKDTLMIFVSGTDSIEFYKGWGNALPQKMIITSSKVIIDKNLKVGVDKNIFRQKFKKHVLPDTLVISDIEGGNVFTFFFEENKLIKILYQAEYTD